MARLRSRRPSGRTVDDFDLLVGPVEGGPTIGDIEALWRLRRDAIMSGRNGRCDGRRPWGWWHEIGEERPDGDAETIRLAELGDLTADELAALCEEANEAKLRIGTGSERISGGWRTHGVSLDQQAVELWEGVKGAVGASSAKRRDA